MQITIETDANTLQKVQRATGQHKKAPALQHPIESFLREQHKREVLEKVQNGGIDFQYTNDKIEAMGEYDADSPRKPAGIHSRSST